MSRSAFRRCFLAVALASLAAAPLLALINPTFTPVELVRDSSAVLVLRIAAPADGQMTAEVVEALVGAAPSEKKLLLDFRDAEDLAEEKVAKAFDGARSALGVMCIKKKKRDGVLEGSLEIGVTWMGMTHAGKDKWKLDRDPNDLETVWGSSARLLVPAVRYAVSEPGASFPVASLMTWGRDASLGKLAGKANGCLLTADGIIVLSDGGDRVYQPAKGAAPADITAKLGLATRSKALASGDFNGDGRMDLASWDGSRLWLALRKEDGQFAVPAQAIDLAECRSLDVLDGGLVAGGSKGATLLKPDGKGGFVASQLPGAGGPCAVADFDGDGLADIIQVSAQGLSIHAGQRDGGFAAATEAKLSILKNPSAVVCADFDTDGQLELLVSGEGGAAMLGRVDGQWKDIMPQTGELHASLGSGADVGAACLADVNADGRLGMALFRPSGSPELFFSRGFACFGVSRSLAFGELKRPVAEALGAGQQAGIAHDLDGDGVLDLLAVDRQQNVWVMHGEAKDPRDTQLTLSANGKSPLTVTATFGGRKLGMRVLRPGEPAVICAPEPGKLTLQWKAPDGKPQTREVVIEGPKKLSL